MKDIKHEKMFPEYDDFSIITLEYLLKAYKIWPPQMF